MSSTTCELAEWDDEDEDEDEEWFLDEEAPSRGPIPTRRFPFRRQIVIVGVSTIDQVFSLVCLGAALAVPAQRRRRPELATMARAASSGVGAAGNYPVEFSSDENVAWKVALPGSAARRHAVWDDSIFVTCGIDGRDGVVCYAMDGSERWRHQFGPERPGKIPTAAAAIPRP